MTASNRRTWIQQSLLASTAILAAGPLSCRSSAGERSTTKNSAYRFHFNENPYGPPASSLKAAQVALTSGNRYPFEGIMELKKAIADYHGVETKQILITAGSTEVLSLLGQHVGLQAGEILMSDQSFPTLARFGNTCGAQVRKIPLAKDGMIDLGRILDSVNEASSLVYICNPNNPTSTFHGLGAVEDFCRSIPSNVLIAMDEAYIQYAPKGEDSSVIPLVTALPNLVVCRTFSKAYGLAGMRIGYTISDSKNIVALKKRHTGYELSAGIAPVVMAHAAITDYDFILKVIEHNITGRKLLYEAFDKWQVKYDHSATNFVRCEDKRFVPDLVKQLEEEDIYITKWSSMTDHIRISIQWPEEVSYLVDRLSEYVI